MIKIQLDSDDWTNIQNAMFFELQKCGSNPPNRFLRMAFNAACKEIGIELVYDETGKEQK
jgi:hypothetical protein